MRLADISAGLLSIFRVGSDHPSSWIPWFDIVQVFASKIRTSSSVDAVDDHMHGLVLVLIVRVALPRGH